jgi:protocatechuate 3,4-dioxygenase beta subunit
MTRWITFMLIISVLMAGCSASITPTTHSETTPLSLPIVESAATAVPSAQETSISEAPTQPAPTIESQPAAIDCTSPATLTPALTEGPYFKAGSPERNSLLAAGISETELTLTGYVLTTDCQPVASARVEFWQADANGVYDNAGYTLRGHQFTDETGKYSLETVVPGINTGRTEHIHVKVQAPNGPVLTTQLFFPDVAENQSDRIYDPALVLPITQAGDGQAAKFNFIISTK